MITLYSYPTLFGMADNNGYGLKVFAFLRMAGLKFEQEHIFDASRRLIANSLTSSMTATSLATATSFSLI